jgi:hypothetical protein
VSGELMPYGPVLIRYKAFTKNELKLKMIYSDCQKNVPFAEGFFATTAYAAILLIGTYL